MKTLDEYEKLSKIHYRVLQSNGKPWPTTPYTVNVHSMPWTVISEGALILALRDFIEDLKKIKKG